MLKDENAHFTFHYNQKVDWLQPVSKCRAHRQEDDVAPDTIEKMVFNSWIYFLGGLEIEIFFFFSILSSYPQQRVPTETVGYFFFEQHSLLAKETGKSNFAYSFWRRHDCNCTHSCFLRYWGEAWSRPIYNFCRTAFGQYLWKFQFSTRYHGIYKTVNDQ